MMDIHDGTASNGHTLMKSGATPFGQEKDPVI